MTDIEDEVYRCIKTGKATRAAELVVRVLNRRLHLTAHRRHLADVRAGKLIAGRVPARRSPEETASRLVDRALQKLCKNGDIVPAGRGWRVR
jgi:hypothetical protein